MGELDEMERSAVGKKERTKKGRERRGKEADIGDENEITEKERRERGRVAEKMGNINER